MKEKLHLPCLRGVIGDWVYYSTLMDAQQIADWIKTAKDIRESKSLDDHLQRTLKERKTQIAKYLQTNDSRFFNSIIVGVFGGVPDWIEFDLSKLGGYLYNDEELQVLKESMGILVFDGDENMFAIDGQHRVEGIRIAYSKPDFAENNKDQFSVLFVAHIDDEEGKKRTRRLFSDINKNAKPVSKGDTIIIDEQDLSAIVTRRLYRFYQYFDKGRQILLTEESNLPPNDAEHFTNLTSLHKAVQIVRKDMPKTKIKTIEQEDILISEIFNNTSNALNFLITHYDVYNTFFVQKKVLLKILREETKDITFRPVGFFLLVRLYQHFYKNGQLDKLKIGINKLNFSMPSSFLNLILWNKGRIETSSKKQDLAFNLSLYLLDSFSGDENELLSHYREILKSDTAELPAKLVL
jgi:DNA sulfur modification protein DndB